MTIKYKILLPCLLVVFFGSLMVVSSADAGNCYCSDKSSGEGSTEYQNISSEEVCKTTCKNKGQYFMLYKPASSPSTSSECKTCYCKAKGESSFKKLGSSTKTQADCIKACGTDSTISCTDPTPVTNTCGDCYCLDSSNKSVINGDLSVKDAASCKSSCEKKKYTVDKCVKTGTADTTTTTTTPSSSLTRTASLAACKAKATKDRGIFTRGLSDYCMGCGECTQCDVFQVISNIISFVFSIAGALAVFFIVNAGFSFAMARGNQEAITKAKSALAAVVIGVIIILIAWALVNTVLSFWLGYDRSSFGDWFYPKFNC